VIEHRRDRFDDALPVACAIDETGVFQKRMASGLPKHSCIASVSSLWN
jgi:hypothetical protein